MSATLLPEEVVRDHPIDLIEDLVADHAWPFERVGEDDISVCASGSWCDYNLAFSLAGRLAGRLDVLTISAAFDFRTPRPRRGEICQLLAQINERLLLGHFDLSSDDNLIVFRHSVPLGGGASATSEQCDQMLRAAVDACERFYPAFQFVLWGGKSADEAYQASILDCRGEA